MSLKTILHSDLAKTLAHMAANRIIGADVVDEIIAVTSGGVLPEGADHKSVIQMAADGVKILDGLDKAAPAEVASTNAAGNGFKFGRKSLAELVGVHPELVKFANQTLAYSTQDFMIFDGLRTQEEQATYVRNGTSKTMQSMHLKQSDGFGHAIDMVPVVGTAPKWDWNLIYPVVDAAIKAASDLGIAEKIVWGGAWDRRLSDLTGRHDIKTIVNEYAERHPGKDFLDGPHFELRL